ncbi:hypothetical protein GCM10023323_17900 [Streptomyces thinghirensis]|uniref:Uncharacterized protein n=1 Tax=Streptomyces thinghirensis TaxID=551547 RepID=A0ABP9SYB8_9ACTN
MRRWAGLASNGYDSSSLDAAINGSEDGESALADFIGTEDAARAMVDDFHRLLTRLRDGMLATNRTRPLPRCRSAEIGGTRPDTATRKWSTSTGT